MCVEVLQIPVDMQGAGRERNLKEVAYVPYQNKKFRAVVPTDYL